MLKINLLPEHARRESLTTVEQFHRTPLMAIAVVVLVAVPVLYAIPSHLRRRQLRALEAKISELQPRSAEVERLQQTVRQLRAQHEAFEGLKTGYDRWAKRLQTLSAVTPEGVWFTELTLDRSKGLVIQGSAIGQGDPEMVSVTRLVQGLKADAGFSSAVKDIQIESIKRVPEGEVEVVQFTLMCALADEGKP